MKRRSMKILHVIPTLNSQKGGPSKACFEMARSMVQRGHIVSIQTTTLLEPNPQVPALGKVEECDSVTIHRHPIRRPQAWAYSPRLVRCLRETIPSVDIVHLHSLYLFPTWATGRECARSSVPYILHPHGSLDSWHYRRKRWKKKPVEVWFQDSVTRSAAAVQLATEKEKQEALPRLFGARTAVVPIGLDFCEYAQPTRGRFRAAHPEIGGRPIVLFLGRLDLKKGLDLLVDAFAETLRLGCRAHLVIAGPDHGMQKQVETWVEERGLRERTTLTGQVTGTDKLDLLADSDLFVLPSQTESFGIAVIEAMASGLPFVISDQVGVEAEIAQANAGWVVPTATAPLRDAMAEALRDAAGARAKGARGRAFATQRFSWDRIAAAQEEIYASIL